MIDATSLREPRPLGRNGRLQRHPEASERRQNSRLEPGWQYDCTKRSARPLHRQAPPDDIPLKICRREAPAVVGLFPRPGYWCRWQRDVPTAADRSVAWPRLGSGSEEDPGDQNGSPTKATLTGGRQSPMVAAIAFRAGRGCPASRSSATPDVRKRRGQKHRPPME